MNHLSEQEFENRMNQIQKENEELKRLQILKQEKAKYKQKIKLPSTSKLVLFGAILICIEIVIFSEIVMYRFQDMSAMYALIGIPAALAPIIIGYYNKAKAENTSGGITYDAAMKESAQNNDTYGHEDNISEDDSEG